MTKTHNVQATIINNSLHSLTYKDSHFDSGRLADGQHWPQTIASGQTVSVLCYERDFSPIGCSGWVEYSTGSGSLYFAFSNPLGSSNKVGFGNQKSVWNDMESHYDNSVIFSAQMDNPDLWFLGQVISSEGTTNNAAWIVSEFTFSTGVAESNIVMVDVQSAFSATAAASPTREYFSCSDAPTYITGLAQSHFKGLAYTGGRVIFSHTNLDIGAQNGKYMLGDTITGETQGFTVGTYDTAHPGWHHPCGAQACGTFMALGIQEVASPSPSTSEIQIYDIRSAIVHQPVTLIGTIPNPGSNVNGVGMTKELGPDGRYIVAAIDGTTLKLFRSTTSSLTQGTVAFDKIYDQGDFPTSGPGLALITQQDGAIFMVTLNADDDGSNSEMRLFGLHDLDTGAPSWTPLLTQAMPVPDMSESVTLLQKYIVAIVVYNPVIGAALEALLATLGAQYLNSSFRWGKGLTITSETTFQVHASDRNVLPLSRIPLIGSDKDFSVLTWGI
ncbi:hypothetical protein [Deinococcus soli (ex Cha et al. 2016)]|uniref:Uncharacterized protein n=2 Tax=Deinococcus soli (ex Cha et al. 2016) TaxID=1309411 RepID=A0ACC6KH32_9DEIO|nr:hypothetical protein [Deinococcus soli (ex Cha et al. 2016)]MDR6218838.1 hypothetical protein [Deinococcus soli (ex Cha et al. 2016)]MDR6328635.1 hypothetical protein [Deinococcus soli (ex Cha et al. 2016)]MDR6751878.1 hypothetical protein [Deinococcus soli (ex Cha et al. 2016)]